MNPLTRRQATAGLLAAAAGPALAVARCGFRLSFGSCAKQDEPQPIWDAVLREQADVHLFGGDNVYASGPLWSEERLRAAYAKALGLPAVRALPASSSLTSTRPRPPFWRHSLCPRKTHAGSVRASTPRPCSVRRAGACRC